VRPLLVVRFAIDGDLRFLSHHDTVRLFARVLARAAWPVKFSEGFNPKPKLSLPLPRNVGIASEDELLVVELAESIAPDEALGRLVCHVPDGIRVHSVQPASAKAKPQPVRCWYTVDLEDPPASLVTRLRAFLEANTHTVQRTTPGSRKVKSVDVRSYVESATFDGKRLTLQLRVTPEGAARPMEVLAAIGLPDRALAHRLRRTRVEWTPLETPAAPADAS
jgi:radical SAM-linked protein